MKPYSVLILAVLTAALIGGACSKGYESQKKVNDLRLTLSADRYPLVKGDNVLRIKTADTSGKTVTDAIISARYYMPPMPGWRPWILILRQCCRATIMRSQRISRWKADGRLKSLFPGRGMLHHRSLLISMHDSERRFFP